MKINEMVRFMNACDIVLDFIANFIQMTFRNVISDDLLPYIQSENDQISTEKGNMSDIYAICLFLYKKKLKLDTNEGSIHLL